MKKNSAQIYSEFSIRLNNGIQNTNLESKKLSSKYQKISKIAEEEILSGNFSNRHIKSWSQQDDLGVPIQLRRLINIDEFFLENLLCLLRDFLPHNFLKKEFKKHALQDDLNVLSHLGFISILKQNPLLGTPFTRDIYFSNKLSFNSRYLRYIYIVGQIEKYKLLSQDKKQTHVDIGNYYGGLQTLLYKKFPHTSFVSIELPHQLFRSYLYHKKMFPDATQIVGVKELEYYQNQREEFGCFIYLLPEDYDLIHNYRKINLLTNFLSFGEMSRYNFDNYMKSPSTLKSKKYYFVNRFISSPSLDKTYDADITVNDYFIKETKLLNFDIFPIHHYMITKRKFLNSNWYRNVASPQFELIQVR